MTSRGLDWSIVAGTLVSVVLLAFGAGMAMDAPSAADAAVGKGLLVLGICAVIVTGALVAAAASTSARTERRAGRADTDWYG